MKVLQRAAAAAATASLAVVLAGCSTIEGFLPGSDTETTTPTTTQAEESTPLSSYVDALQGQIPSVLAAYGDTFSDVEIVGYEPSTVEYAYTYAEQVDAVGSVDYFNTQIDYLQETVDAQLIPEMESFDIVDPQVTYTYYNADGSTIWSYTFSATS